MITPNGQLAPAPAEAGPGGDPSMGVVICAYTNDRWDDLEAAVSAVAEQIRPDDLVVVVVDHNDDLLARARECFADSIRVVPNREARGLSGARNSGVAATSTDVVAFLDDDACPMPGWVEGFRQRFAADPSVAAVGGAIEPRFEGGRGPRWFPMQYGWVIGCDYVGLPADGQEIRNPIGASMAVRRSHIDLVGGFSTRMGRVGTKPTGNEETELGIRVRQLDPAARIVRATRPVVSHWVPRERQTVRYFLRRCYYEGRSKAALAGSVGSKDGLSAERAYVLNTLGAGFLRHFGAVLRGDFMGPARAVALVAGLLTTVAGFLTGRGHRQVHDPLPAAQDVEVR